MSTPFWVCRQARKQPGTPQSSASPYDGSVAGEHDLPGADDVERAVQAAAEVAAETAALPAHVRADALDHVSRSLPTAADEIAGVITAESGKPLKWSRVEVSRAVSTFRWAAEEARPLLAEDAAPGHRPGRRRPDRDDPPRAPWPGAGHHAVQLPAEPGRAQGRPGDRGGRADRAQASARHPADRAGPRRDPVRYRPAGRRLVRAAGAEQRRPRLVADPRLPIVSFTGSVPVGWSIKESVPRKHVALELGGNAAVLVAPDWTDLDYARSASPPSRCTRPASPASRCSASTSTPRTGTSCGRRSWPRSRSSSPGPA